MCTVGQTSWRSCVLWHPRALNRYYTIKKISIIYYFPFILTYNYKIIVRRKSIFLI